METVYSDCKKILYMLCEGEEDLADFMFETTHTHGGEFNARMKHFFNVLLPKDSPAYELTKSVIERLG